MWGSMRAMVVGDGGGTQGAHHDPTRSVGQKQFE